MKPLQKLVVLLLFPAVLSANDLVGAGRAVPDHFQFEIYGGYGGVEALSGEVRERRDAQVFEQGVNADLEDLNLDDGIDSWFWGLRTYNRWVTFLFDYRHSAVDASGRAKEEYRLNVDSIAFAGLSLDYLIIPVDAEYSIDAETAWLGAGFRITPFTLFPEGRIRFTPWAHLGLQYITADYDVDAGATVDLETDGFTGRVYAERGRAKGEAEAAIPEYGLGGEVRVLFHDGSKDFGPELVAQATWKLLDFQGAIDSLGVDSETFEDIDFDYSALEANLYLVYPLNERLDLLAGVYVEQVDVSTILSDNRGAEFEREVDLSYTLYGLRAGFRF